MERREDKPERLVTVASFRTVQEAYLTKALLEDEGIECAIADENIIAAWGWSDPIGGVKVQVRESDAGTAADILEQAGAGGSKQQEPSLDTPPGDQAEEADDDERCPKCGSTRVHYEKYSRRGAFLSALLFGCPFPVPVMKWTCRRCGHRWEEQVHNR